VRKTRSKFFFVGPSPKTRLRVVSLSGSEEEILASEGRKAGRRVGIAVATRPETVKSHRNNPATDQESTLCGARVYQRRASGAGPRSSATNKSSEDAERRLGRATLVSIVVSIVVFIVGWGRVWGRRGVDLSRPVGHVHRVELE